MDHNMQMANNGMVVTLVDDSAYYGLMVYVYDTTGINRWFIPLAEFMASTPVALQALRYGMMFATMNHLRAWLESWGISTELSVYIDQLLNMVTRR